MQGVKEHPQKFSFVKNLGEILENLGTDALTPLFCLCDQ